VWTEEDEKRDEMNEELLVKIVAATMVIFLVGAFAIMISACTPQPHAEWVTTTKPAKE